MVGSGHRLVTLHFCWLCIRNVYLVKVEQLIRTYFYDSLIHGSASFCARAESKLPLVIPL